MENLNLDMPMVVTIGNKSNTTQYFQPCKENFLQELKAGDSITFNINKSFEALYYTEQATKDILVGMVGNNETNLTSGKYEDGTFQPNANTYSFIQNGNKITVIGTIPYAEADATLGLDAGNRICFKVQNPNITSKSELPSGIICKTTNTLIPGGYNEYSKSAFEDDGSLISVFNVGSNKTIEVQVKWTDSQTNFDIYTININATLEPAPAEV